MEPQQHPDGQIVDCPNCGTRVIFTADGLCPACRRFPGVGLRIPSPVATDVLKPEAVEGKNIQVHAIPSARRFHLHAIESPLVCADQIRGQRLRSTAVTLGILYGLSIFVWYVLPETSSALSRNRDLMMQLSQLLFLPLVIVAHRFYREGRRLTAPMATEILKRDHRPPVLYLRAFRDDLFRSIRTPGFERYLFPFPTVEEELALEFRSLGPFVAIGKPGERLPQLGAARIYVPDSQWQSCVSDLMDESQLVILRIGTSVTPGLSWEFTEAIKSVPSERLILYFYPPRMVPDWISNAFPQPAALTKLVTYIYFDQHGLAKSADSIDNVLEAKKMRARRLRDVIRIGAAFVVLTLWVVAIFKYLTAPFAFVAGLKG